MSPRTVIAIALLLSAVAVGRAVQAMPLDALSLLPLPDVLVAETGDAPRDEAEAGRTAGSAEEATGRPASVEEADDDDDDGAGEERAVPAPVPAPGGQLPAPPANGLFKGGARPQVEVQ